MKLVLLFITMLLSSTVHAYSVETPWNVLMRDRRLKLDAPVVFMGHAIDYTFVCVDGDKLRTQKPVEVRETVYHGDEHHEDVVVGHRYLYTPIYHSYKVPYKCRYVGGKGHTYCQQKEVWANYPLKVDILVSILTSPRDYTFKVLFKKPWTVPDCSLIDSKRSESEAR